ncbi:MAG: ATP-binding protein [Tannerellaceae bacterium]
MKLTKYLYLILLLCTVVVCVSCQKDDKKYRVLVIHSFESDYSAYKDFDRLIEKDFQEENIQSEIRTFYLNCDQYKAPEEEANMYKYIDSIANWKPEIILVNEDQASYTLMKCGHPYTATVPVVFSGVNYPNWGLLKSHTNFNGFWDKPDYLTNVHLMEKLLGTIGIYLLHDSTFLDILIKKDVHKQLSEAGYTVDSKNHIFIPEEYMSPQNTEPHFIRPDSTRINIIATQEDRAAVVNWYMSKNAKYKYYLQAKRDFRVANVSLFSSKPSFTVNNKDLGYDTKLVGGYVTSLETQAREAVHRAAEILKGKSVQAYPQVTESAKNYVFDYREIEHWNIDKKSLPENSILLRQLFNEQHPIVYWMLVLLTISSVLAVIIVLFVVNIRETNARRTAQKNLLLEKEALAEALEKAKESDHMKSVFLANMSHEIRTPLNAIIGFSNLIMGTDISQEEKEEYSEIISSNNELLLKLINDILDLSRMESGHMSFKLTLENLTNLIHNVYRTQGVMIPEGVEFREHLPENPIYINIDKLRLTQVLTNFVNNAIKFTKSGYIEIGYQDCPEIKRVHMYVEDTGLGIPKEKQNAIFERFSKLNEFVQGTGLGLSICQVIAKRFHGRILLKSEAGKGSRFTIELPYSITETCI